MNGNSPREAGFELKQPAHGGLFGNPHADRQSACGALRQLIVTLSIQAVSEPAEPDTSLV